MYRIVLSVVGGPEGRKRNAVLTPMCFSLGDVSVGYTMSTVLSFSISSYIITCVRVETRNRRGRCRVRALVGYPQVTRCALRLGTRSTQKKKKNNKKLSIDGGLKRSRFALISITYPRHAIVVHILLKRHRHRYRPHSSIRYAADVTILLWAKLSRVAFDHSFAHQLDRHGRARVSVVSGR